MNPPRIPENLDDDTYKYLRNLTKYLVEEFESRQLKTEGQDSLLLVAPNLSIWEVRVTNAGALTTTKVQG